MIWFLLEHWLTVSVVSGYVAAVVFTYVRFGRREAIAVALLGATLLIYRKGVTDTERRQRQQSERARQHRQEVERNVGEMGAQDVDTELRKWNRD